MSSTHGRIPIYMTISNFWNMYTDIVIMIIIIAFWCILPLWIGVKEETVRFYFWECLDAYVIINCSLYLRLALSVAISVVRAQAGANSFTVVARYLQSCSLFVEDGLSSFAIFRLSPGIPWFT